MKGESALLVAAFVCVWRYEVRSGREAEFERLYGSDGRWARLFGRSAAYLGTDLLRDDQMPRRYLTIDRWVSEAAHAEFVAEHRAEFDELDDLGESLTQTEERIGHFTVIDTASTAAP